MAKVYNNKDIKNLKEKREMVALSKLLFNIKEEEPIPMEYVKTRSRSVKINYKKSFLVLSDIQLYKSYSVFGLIKNFKTNTKYFIIDIAILLDIWYNNSALINKSKLLEPDILILHGKAIEYQAENKATALLELISIRNTLNKLTWLYMEDTTYSKFNDIYPGVCGALSNYYQINLNKSINKVNKDESTTDIET